MGLHRSFLLFCMCDMTVYFHDENKYFETREITQLKILANYFRTSAGYTEKQTKLVDFGDT